MSARRRSAQLGTLLATLLLAAGCGAGEPEPLTAMKPEVPADLCATIPEAARQGLLTNSSTDETGNPTAACSLRSPDGAAPGVSAVVTWLQANDDEEAGRIYDSQCRAIDRSEFTDQSGFQAQGADKGCSAVAKTGKVDSSTMAAAKAREVVTVRLTVTPPGKVPATQQAQQMLEGVLKSLAGS